MNFSDKHFLLALSVIPVLIAVFYVAYRRRENIVKAIGDSRLVQLLIANFSYPRFFIKFGLTVLALSAIIIAVANLQSPSASEDIGRKGVDVMIALDVSKSMLAKDVGTERLAKAKVFMTHLIDELPNDRIGIILFAGRAYLQMPLSTDHGAAEMYIRQASPESVPTQGTVLSEALRVGQSAFVSKERKYKSMVIITDGEDHDAGALPMAEEMQSHGVMINTVGIGSAEGTTIVDPTTGLPKTDVNGNTVVSKLNETILKQLASSTNGAYVKLDEPQKAVTTIVEQLGKIEKTAMKDSDFMTFKSYYYYFVGFAIILLIIEMLLGERKRRLAI